jgi:hypothetical protein
VLATPAVVRTIIRVVCAGLLASGTVLGLATVCGGGAAPVRRWRCSGA